NGEFDVGGKTRLTIGLNGNIGIGQSNPTSSLDITGSSSWDIFNLASASGTSVFHVKKSGNVGIGTTNPGQKLEISGGNILLSQANPVQIASLSDGQSIDDIFLSGNYAFVANATANNMSVYDITTPSTPRLLSTFSQGCVPSNDSRIISGNLIFIACTSSSPYSIRIYDFSNIASPSLLATLPHVQVEFPNSMAVSGRYLYVAQDYVGNNLGIYDIADPRNPKKVGSTGSGDRMNGMDVNGNYFYGVSFQAHKLRIWDIRDP